MGKINITGQGKTRTRGGQASDKSGGSPARGTVTLVGTGMSSGIRSSITLPAFNTDDLLVLMKSSNNNASTVGVVSGTASGAGTRIYNYSTAYAIELLFLNAADGTVNPSAGQSQYDCWGIFRGVDKTDPYADLTNNTTLDGTSGVGLDVTAIHDGSMALNMGRRDVIATDVTITSETAGWTSIHYGTTAGPDQAQIFAWVPLDYNESAGADITYSYPLSPRTGLVLNPGPL